MQLLCQHHSYCPASSRYPIDLEALSLVYFGEGEQEAVGAIQSSEVPERTFPNSTQIAAQLLRSFVWTLQETLFPIDGAG